MDVTLTVTVSLQYLDVENSVWWTEDRKESRFELFYLLTLILIMRNIINDKYRKNIFEHRSKQSREREITPNKKIIQISASGGENTFLEAEHKPGNYTSVYAEAAVSSEGLNQLHLHRWDAEGLTDVWGIWTTQGGSDTKQPGGFCNAHASPAQLGRAVLVIFLNIPACVIYHLYSCNPFQNTQEISM